MDATFAQSFYCRVCMGYIGPTGKRVPYEGEYERKDAIVWVECHRCLDRHLEQQAQEEERRRREEERTRPRECELVECGVSFLPRTLWQRFCCDEHRWRAHRLRKTAAT